mmetsp:Transcript_33873/g.69934  ORF Transcript_33873/g.69934 Transcript_33873/m.69934 type:complete len:327 (-) Transcript_33873:3022-4002(-)
MPEDVEILIGLQRLRQLAADGRLRLELPQVVGPVGRPRHTRVACPARARARGPVRTPTERVPVRGAVPARRLCDVARKRVLLPAAQDRRGVALRVVVPDGDEQVVLVALRLGAIEIRARHARREVEVRGHEEPALDLEDCASGRHRGPGRAVRRVGHIDPEAVGRRARVRSVARAVPGPGRFEVLMPRDDLDWGVVQEGRGGRVASFKVVLGDTGSALEREAGDGCAERCPREVGDDAVRRRVRVGDARVRAVHEEVYRVCHDPGSLDECNRRPGRHRCRRSCATLGARDGAALPGARTTQRHDLSSREVADAEKVPAQETGDGEV